MMKLKPLLLVLLIGIVMHAKADDYPRNYNIDIKHYAFRLGLSDANDSIIGSTSITAMFMADGVQSLRLDFANATTQRAGKGMHVSTVALQDGTPLSFTHQDDVLLIRLPKPSVKGMQSVIVVEYRGVPADGLRIGKTKYGNRSFFNENWPNRTRHWLPTVDHPYDKATSEFIVDAPTKYKVVSNGLLMEESQLGNGFTKTHWKQQVPVSSWLFVLGVAEFAMQHVDWFEGKAIQTWVYPQDREKGFADFASPSKETLAFLSAYVGPYVYEKLANIQSPSVGGGMETSSAIFYAENLVDGKKSVRLRNVVIHEIAHQWFGNAVTESTWDDAWLSEGITTYFTLLFQEYAYGHAEYMDGLIRAKKSVYDYSKKDSTFSIVSNRTAEKEPVTSGITYQKGAWVLHMLRERIGNENFRKGIRAYYAKYLNANATTDDFIREMEMASGQDLKVFFAQWLNRPENPKLNIRWTYDASAKQVVVDVSQIQSGFRDFRFPLDVDIVGSDAANSKKVTVQVEQSQQRILIPSEKKPFTLRFDPQTRLLAEIFTN